jgi:IS4 transposase
MRHHNSVLHALLKQVPWHAFDRLVDEHEADRGVRRLSTRSQLIALLFGQLGGAVSLREIETSLSSHAVRLYHVGANPVSRSTLADANRTRPAGVFAGLFAVMAGQASRGLRKKLGEAVRLIDSTALPLPRGARWAHFSARACGAKLHMVYDPDADRPLYAAVTAGRVNDISAARAMPVEPGATYVFDLGYYDYRWWADLDAAGCRIVTRFKRNTPLAGHGIAGRTLPKDGAILSDRIGTLPQRQAGARKNPFSRPVREICVRIESGKVLRLLSNDLHAPAEEIAALYKRRWQIELFFRWVKQTLKIRHFLGTSQNAVRIQIAVALIAFLLLRLAQQATSLTTSPLAFARLVSSNLMHRRRIDGLLGPPEPAPADTRQLALCWA